MAQRNHIPFYLATAPCLLMILYKILSEYDLTKMLHRKTETKNVYYDCNNIAELCSPNSSDVLDKCEYLAGEGIVPSGQDIVTEQKN